MTQPQVVVVVDDDDKSLIVQYFHDEFMKQDAG